jgi:hypothetical protein
MCVCVWMGLLHASAMERCAHSTRAPRSRCGPWAWPHWRGRRQACPHTTCTHLEVGVVKHEPVRGPAGAARLAGAVLGVLGLRLACSRARARGVENVKAGQRVERATCVCDVRVCRVCVCVCRVCAQCQAQASDAATREPSAGSPGTLTDAHGRVRGRARPRLRPRPRRRRRTKAGAVGARAAERVRPRQRHNLLVVHAHAVKHLAQVVAGAARAVGEGRGGGCVGGAARRGERRRRRRSAWRQRQRAACWRRLPWQQTAAAAPPEAAACHTHIHTRAHTRAHTHTHTHTHRQRHGLLQCERRTGQAAVWRALAALGGVQPPIAHGDLGPASHLRTHGAAVQRRAHAQRRTAAGVVRFCVTALWAPA